MCSLQPGIALWSPKGPSELAMNIFAGRCYSAVTVSSRAAAQVLLAAALCSEESSACRWRSAAEEQSTPKESTSTAQTCGASEQGRAGSSSTAAVDVDGRSDDSAGGSAGSTITPDGGDSLPSVGNVVGVWWQEDARHGQRGWRCWASPLPRRAARQLFSYLTGLGGSYPQVYLPMYPYHIRTGRTSPPYTPIHHPYIAKCGNVW